MAQNVLLSPVYDLQKVKGKTMKQRVNTSVSLALAGVLMVSSIGGALVPAAQAKGSTTWRNGAIAGGAIAGYGLLKHNKTATIAGLGVGGYSLYRRNKAKKNERRQASAYRSRRYGYRAR